MNRRRVVHVCVLIVVAIATLRPVVSVQFFSVDDPAFIEENEIAYPLDAQSILQAWSRSTRGLFVPVPNIVWSLISEYAKTDAQNPPKLGYARYPNQRFNPFAFHLVSLACHIITGVLVYACLIWLGVGSWGAFFGAGVFLLHPVQVEGIAWASLLKDLLATAFSSAALLLYLVYVDSRTRIAARLSYTFGFIFYLLALCSKPGAIMLPFIIVLIGLALLKRPIRRLLREMIPWALCAIPIMAVTSNVQLVDAAAQFEILDYHLRPLIALDALCFYLVKLVAPLELAFDYGRSPGQILGSSWIYVSWIPPLILGAFVYLKRKQYPYLLVGYGVLILGLLPTLGLRTFSFQTFSTVTDHYLSLSMLGVAIGVGSSFDHWSSREKPSLMALIIGFAMLGSLCLKSNLQLSHWMDSHAIYQQAINVNPASWFSYRMLGLEQQLDHQPDRALEYYRKSMAINGNTYGHSGLFASLNESEDFKRAHEVISDVVDAHQRDSDYFTRAQISYKLGHVAAAIRDLEHAKERNPSREMSARIAHALEELDAMNSGSGE